MPPLTPRQSFISQEIATLAAGRRPSAATDLDSARYIEDASASRKPQARLPGRSEPRLATANLIQLLAGPFDSALRLRRWRLDFWLCRLALLSDAPVQLPRRQLIHRDATRLARFCFQLRACTRLQLARATGCHQDVPIVTIEPFHELHVILSFHELGAAESANEATMSRTRSPAFCRRQRSAVSSNSRCRDK